MENTAIFQRLAAEEEKKKGRKRKVVLGIIILLLLLALTGLIWWRLGNGDDGDGSRELSAGLMPGGGSFDPDAYAEEMIRIQINSRPVFPTGDSDGPLYIGNPETNNYDMEVEIALDSTGEVVYASGLIPPGYFIDNDKLDKVLDNGSYPAVATITYYTEDGGIQAVHGAKLTIVVGEE